MWPQNERGCSKNQVCNSFTTVRQFNCLALAEHQPLWKNMKSGVTGYNKLLVTKIIFHVTWDCSFLRVWDCLQLSLLRNLVNFKKRKLLSNLRGPILLFVLDIHLTSNSPSSSSKIWLPIIQLRVHRMNQLLVIWSKITPPLSLVYLGLHNEVSEFTELSAYPSFWLLAGSLYWIYAGDPFNPTAACFVVLASDLCHGSVPLLPRDADWSALNTAPSLAHALSGLCGVSTLLRLLPPLL